VKSDEVIIGQRFDKLTVLEKEFKLFGHYPRPVCVCKCSCVCGNITEVDVYSLLSKNTKSCGCNKHRSKTNDLTGRRFGRLTVLEISDKHIKPSGQKCNMWKCKCDCGVIKTVWATSLSSGETLSCGCLRDEKSIEASTTHGLSKFEHAEYKTWLSMKSRCNNQNNNDYKNYGGRGIKVCDKWSGEMGFKNFIDDMGKRPGSNYSLDRINVDGNYEPTNCKWSTKIEQNQNKRTSIIVIYNGTDINLMELARTLDINYATLKKRYRAGWTIEKMTTTPAGKYKLCKTNKNYTRGKFNSRKKRHGYIRDEDTLTYEQAMDVLKKQDYKCAYFEDCKRCQDGGYKLTIDHKKAKSKGGFDTMENIQWVCVSCNSSKFYNDKPKPLKNRNSGTGSSIQ
jgi:hypothetical protein